MHTHLNADRFSQCRCTDKVEAILRLGFQQAHHPSRCQVGTSTLQARTCSDSKINTSLTFLQGIVYTCIVIDT